MLADRSMAGLAVHSGTQVLELQFALADSAGGMAAEAVARSDGIHLPSGGLFDVLRAAAHSAHREIQRPQRVVEAQTALVETAAMFEHVGLSGLSTAKRPQE